MTNTHRVSNRTVIGILAVVFFTIAFVVVALAIGVRGVRMKTEAIESGALPVFSKNGELYGAFKNNTPDTLNGVAIRVDFLNESGSKIDQGVYTSGGIKPGEVWEFRLKAPKEAVSSRYASVTGF